VSFTIEAQNLWKEYIAVSTFHGWFCSSSGFVLHTAVMFETAVLLPRTGMCFVLNI